MGGIDYASNRDLSPSDIVIHFIHDYAVWNEFALSSYSLTKSFDQAESAYGDLVKRYCIPGKVHLDITFGGKCSHTPGHERIVEESLLKDSAIVKTAQFSVSEDIYHEYHFTRLNEVWALQEIYYLDEFDNYRPLRIL